MRFLLLSSLLGIMCSCSAPKLTRNGNIRCLVYDTGSIKHRFDYPNDAKSRQILDQWLNYYNKQSYWLTLAEAAVPEIALHFPNGTQVYLYSNSSYVYISPLSIRQYKRKCGDEDKEFMNYLFQLPNN